MKKYYYIVIDKVCKTLEVMECNTCEANLQKEILKKYGLSCQWYSQSRFTVCFNNTDNNINYDTLYKYARKFEVI